MDLQKKNENPVPEKLLEASFDAIQEGITVLDNQHNILRVNRVTEDRYSYALPLEGKKCYKIFRSRTEPCSNCPSLRVQKTGKPATEVMPLVQDGTETGWIKIYVYPLKDDFGNITGVIEFVRDITEEVKKQEGFESSRQRAERQRAALASISVDRDFALGNLPEATRVLLEKAAAALQTERNSIWLFSEDESEVCCIGLYEASKKQHGHDSAFKVNKYPRYVEAIRRENRLYASDSCSDPRLSELKETYIQPLGITSTLDAGIFLEGKLRGIVSFEHVGKNGEWHSDDEAFASTIASLFGQVLAHSSRKMAEDVLQVERNQLLSIFDSISEVIYVSDPYTNEILYANKYLKELLGKDITGEICHKVLEGSDQPCDFCTNDIILNNNGAPYRWEYHNSFLDKEYLVTNRIIKWPDGRDVRFGLAVDLADRKKAEQLLERSREWYRALAEDIPALVVRISAQGLITYVNDTSCTTIGKSREEIMGQSYFRFIPTKYQKEVEETLTSLSPEQPIATLEYQIKSLWIRWKIRVVFDAEGQLKEYFIVGEDITEQRTAENKLRENEARSRALVDAVPDMMFRLDREGRYLDAEIKDAKQLTEKGQVLYEAGRLIGSLVCEVLDSHIAIPKMEGIQKALETGELQIQEYSYDIDGDTHHFEERLVSTGEEVLSIVRDITAKKEAIDTLTYQFEFEKMVAKISSLFVDTSAERVNEALDYALQLSGEFFDLDRCYICRYIEDSGAMHNTHEWCAEGICSMKAANQGFLIEDTPWWANYLYNLEHLYVPDIEALPPEADKDKAVFRAEGTRSFLTIPMLMDGKLMGIYGFTIVTDKKPLTSKQIALLKVVSEIISGAIVKYDAENALKESEERYRDILATMEEGYYEADLSGLITYCNDAACRILGYKSHEISGIDYTNLYKDPTLAINKFSQVLLTGNPERGLILEMIRKDGSTYYGELSVSLIRDQKGSIKGFKGIGKDVTERVEYEKRLKYLSLHDQLTGIYNRTLFETELDRLDKSREYPITIVSADLDGLKLVNDTLGHDAGNKLLKDCAAILDKSLRKSDILARVGGDEFSAILPRTGKETAEKIIRRIKKNIADYNQGNQDLPLGVSIGVATADYKDIALKDVFKRADDLMYRDKLYCSSNGRSKIVESLLAALAERDYITEGHARRLEMLCRAVGEKINLSPHQLIDLTLLAQVHDLGKVGIPDSILFKPGPLTEDEWEIMRGHPEKGFRIASSSPDLSSVAFLILKHHERWDGSGYPLGLKEVEIPVECRILAIVDAFDAMTHNRPYGQIRTTGEAEEELKKCAGSQFDPELVQVFLSVLEETGSAE